MIPNTMYTTTTQEVTLWALALCLQFNVRQEVTPVTHNIYMVKGIQGKKSIYTTVNSWHTFCETVNAVGFVE